MNEATRRLTTGCCPDCGTPHYLEVSGDATEISCKICGSVWKLDRQKDSPTYNDDHDVGFMF